MESLCYRMVRLAARTDVDDDPDPLSVPSNRVPSTLVPVEALWYFMLFCDETQRSVWDHTLHNRLRAALAERGASGACISMTTRIHWELKNHTKRYVESKMRGHELTLTRELPAFGVDMPVRDASGAEGVKMWTSLNLTLPSVEDRRIDWLDSNGRVRTRATAGFVYRGFVGYTAREVYGQAMQLRLPTSDPEVTAIVTIVSPTMAGEAGIKVLMAQVLGDPSAIALEPYHAEIHMPNIALEASEPDLLDKVPRKGTGAALRQMRNSAVAAENPVVSTCSLNIHGRPWTPEGQMAYKFVRVTLNHPFFLMVHVNDHIVFGAMIRNVE